MDKKHYLLYCHIKITYYNSNIKVIIQNILFLEIMRIVEFYSDMSNHLVYFEITFRFSHN